MTNRIPKGTAIPTAKIEDVGGSVDVEAYMAERIPQIDAAIEARFDRASGQVPPKLLGAMLYRL